MNSSIKRLFALALVALLAACGSGSAPDEVPTGVTAVPGDGYVTVSWESKPGYTYWVFSAAADSITRDNYLNYPSARITKDAVSPQIIAALANGTRYSFIVNATEDGSPAGPASASISAMPRLAGSQWTPGASIGSFDLRGLTYWSAKYVAVGTGGAIYTSGDGLTWTAATASATTTALNAAAVSSAMAIAVGDSGTIVTSTDAATWTARTSGVTANLNAVVSSGLYVAVGDNGTIITSADAATWTARTSGTTQRLNGVAYQGGKYMVVGNGGTLLTSTDAITWTAVNVGTTADLYDLAYGNATHVIVGAQGSVLSSADAATWTVQPAITTQTLRSVLYSSQFVAVGNAGVNLYGTDGASWSLGSTGTTATLYAVTRGGDYNYVAVGAAGTQLVSR